MSDLCEWYRCPEIATRVIYDMKVKPKGSRQEAFVGNVELCFSHFMRAQRLGRVELDPDRLVWALETLDEEEFLDG